MPMSMPAPTNSSTNTKLMHPHPKEVSMTDSPFCWVGWRVMKRCEGGICGRVPTVSKKLYPTIGLVSSETEVDDTRLKKKSRGNWS